jgi:TolA-binding protein
LLKKYPHSRYADDAQYWKAKALLQQNKDRRAMRLLEKMLQTNNNSRLYRQAAFLLAETEFEYGRKNASNRNYLRKAANHFTWYQQNYPSDANAAQALVRAGECHEIMGDYSNARFYYRKTIDEYPNTSAAYKARDKINGYW